MKTKLTWLLVGAVATVSLVSCAASESAAGGSGSTITIGTPMTPPAWAELERKVLADNVPAAREFFQKYYDNRGYLQCFVRWGADDGADDAFENFNGWPDLHAIGASDELQDMYLKGHEGMIKQYTEARTVEVPAGKGGIYYKEFDAQQDWMHHGEGLQLFNRMGLSIPNDAKYQERARRFAGFYMGEDPEAANYDPQHKIIRSLMNGSRGPLLRQATSIDWVGDPFDPTGFITLHAERNFKEMLAHYEEYHDVVGDSFLNLAATVLPMDAYLVTGDEKYKRWIVDYMDAWVERIRQNNGIIPSFVDLDGKIGGPKGTWWGNAYGWGFSPVNPVTGKREDRNRVPRALVGFNNVLWVTGDQKYVDVWRNQINAVNSHGRETDGQKQYPTMYGEQGWYGWRNRPWEVGALEVWYWSQKPEDLERVPKNAWIDFLQGRNPAYPETALQNDLAVIQKRLAGIRADKTPPEKRLADNMLDLNPVVAGSLIRLTQGGMEPGRDGGVLNARLRYFDPERKRAGLPEDVAVLISEMSDTATTVTFVNLNKSTARTLVVQGGAFGEHQIDSVDLNGRTTAVNKPTFSLTLSPGAGGKALVNMKRYVNKPTESFPWDRQ